MSNPSEQPQPPRRAQGKWRLQPQSHAAPSLGLCAELEHAATIAATVPLGRARVLEN